MLHTRHALITPFYCAVATCRRLFASAANAASRIPASTAPSSSSSSRPSPRSVRSASTRSVPSSTFAVAPSSSSFSSLPLPASLQSSLTSLNLTAPTPIQSAALSPLLAGQHALIASATGSGKTLAYLLPVIANLIRDEQSGNVSRRLARPRAIVVVPNRELAIQILSVAKSLSGAHADDGAAGGRFRSVASTGFIPLSQLARSFRTPIDLLIITPGRLEFLLSSNRLFLTDVKYVVLDETDTLLSVREGFRDDMERLLLKTAKFRCDEMDKERRMKEKMKTLAGGAGEKKVSELANTTEAMPSLATTPPPSPRPPIQLIFSSASISPSIESYLLRMFPSLTRIHTPSLHHLPPSLIRRNILVGTQDKRELLLSLLKSESESYKKRLMHGRTRQQNKEDLERLGGNEQAFWNEIIAQDVESRLDERSAAILRRSQLSYDEGRLEQQERESGSQARSEKENEEQEETADDTSDPDHPSHSQSNEEVPPPPPIIAKSLNLPLPPTIIFTNSVSCCRAVAWYLAEQGLNVGHYHGLMPVHYRTHHFRNFLSGRTSILVATDLASRGLDMTFVQHIIHFDFPFSVLDFIHRVGRTARNGGKGKSTALVCKRDRVLADAIERLSNRGLSIEQLSNDKARYGPDGLPISDTEGNVNRSAAAAATSNGVKQLAPARVGRSPSSSSSTSISPRRRWMRYMSPSARNQHKLLYSRDPSSSTANQPTDKKTVRQMRREPERGVRTIEDEPKPREADPFAFSAPPHFRVNKSIMHSEARARMSGKPMKGKSSQATGSRSSTSSSSSSHSASQKQQTRLDQHRTPSKFPSASGSRRPTPSRPIGPLAHKQRVGAIFAQPKGEEKSKSKTIRKGSNATRDSPDPAAGRQKQRESNRKNSVRKH